MKLLPKYIGPAAFGIKTGVILPGDDLLGLARRSLEPCHEDGLLEQGDVFCITESALARSQNNYVSIEDISRQVAKHLQLAPDSTVGVLFPLASRNRFAMILEGIAAAVPKGKVLVQLSFPGDEVGNPFLPESFVFDLGKDLITKGDLVGKSFRHPLTGVDYIQLYERTICMTGAEAEIYLCNDPRIMAGFNPDGVIVAGVHTRQKTVQAIRKHLKKYITLQDICSDPAEQAWSEWGLLGSNVSSRQRLKLAPRKAEEFAIQLKECLYQAFQKDIEVIIYGDGAYKDPSSGIYELADPQPAFGATVGVSGRLRRGVKYKYLADVFYEEGRTPEEIEALVEEKCLEERPKDCADCPEEEGTTPRKIKDILASLADLVSGSADAGTPFVLIKGFLN